MAAYADSTLRRRAKSLAGNILYGMPDGRGGLRDWGVEDLLRAYDEAVPPRWIYAILKLRPRYESIPVREQAEREYARAILAILRSDYPERVAEQIATNRAGRTSARGPKGHETIDFDAFFDAYVEAAFFTSTDESDESGGRPMDENYDRGDLGKADLAEMRRDAVEFADAHADLIRGREAKAGHDFWLTRNGHGAGFWDGDWEEPAATILTEASRVFGEQSLYLANPSKRGRHAQKVYVYPPPKARKHTLKMRAERAARKAG